MLRNKDIKLIQKQRLVMEVLTDTVVIRNIRGKAGIGHVRYSTQGGSDVLHAQPLL